MTRLLELPEWKYPTITRHIYGPKRFLLFGKRELLYTEEFQGMEELVGYAMIDFDVHYIPLGKKIDCLAFVTETDTIYLHGVIPAERLAGNTWNCLVDHMHRTTHNVMD